MKNAICEKLVPPSLLLLLSLLCVNTILIAQEGEIMTPTLELFIKQVNVSGGTIAWVLNGQGTCWKREDSSYYINGNSTNINPTPIYLTGEFESDTGYNSHPWEGTPITFITGLYRLMLLLDGDAELMRIFVDYRDRRYWEGTVQDWYYPDHELMYNGYLNKIRWRSIGMDEDTGWVEDGDTLRIWTVRGKSGPPNTTRFQPNKIQNLAITSETNHPKITWSSAVGPYLTGINVYRTINRFGGGPGTFGLLTTLTSTATSFADEDLAYGGEWRIYYKVAAVNSGVESVHSDTVNCTSSGFMKMPGKSDNRNSSPVKAFDSGIYPNPFNPSTTIAFSLPEPSRVQMSLYDIIGRRIRVLTDAVYEKGSYSLAFSLQGYSSGIYFVRYEAIGLESMKTFVKNHKVTYVP